MSFEKTPWRLASYEVRPQDDLFVIRGERGSLVVDKYSVEYLQYFALGKSLYEMVEFFLSKGQLPSFQRIKELAQKLLEKGILISPQFPTAQEQSNWFQKIRKDMEEQWSALHSTKSESGLLGKIIFFRQLPDPVRNLFEAQAKKYEIPANVRLVAQGSASRDMFVLTKGHMVITQKTPEGRIRHLGDLLPGAVFGEGAFLLGKPRTADISSVQISEVIRIPWDANRFDAVINSQVAERLQARIWVHHAFLNNSFLSQLSPETVDQLAFAGQFRQWSAGQILFREGDAGRFAGILTRGEVLVSQNGKSIRILKQGDVFGEVSLMASQGKRTGTLVCQKDAEALVIDYVEFYRFLAGHLELACGLEAMAYARLADDQKRSAN